ncbi:MAG TPA: TonB-dependent receptor [Gemmatimonadales bacterium]|jgi:iron complex outermembrane receptor protein
MHGLVFALALGAYAHARLVIPDDTIVAAPAASDVQGTVTDSAGAGIPDARVTLVELRRTTTTDPTGRFGFTDIAPGSYRLSVSAIGFAPVVAAIMVSDDNPPIRIALRPSVVELEALQVTASPSATTLLNSPQPVSSMGGQELQQAQAPSLGETIEALPGVRSLSTGTGIGKPVIRGLTSNRVLVVADGQRLETQQWGDEHGPNVDTEDAERIEVIRGPASVLYGSDALGGVVNVVPKELPEAIGRSGFVSGDVSTAYSTNNRQPDGTLAMEGANGGLGFRASVTGRTSDDVRTPAGALFNSGNRALGGTGSLGYRGAWGSVNGTFTHRDERLEIHEDPAEDPTATPLQRIGEDRGKVGLTLPLGNSRLEADAGFERNRRREFETEDATDVALGLLSKTYTANLHFHHAPVGRWAGAVGVSGLYNSFDKFGEETLIPNTTSKSAGIYLFEQAEYGRWGLSVGARYDYRRLDAEADAVLGTTAQRRTYNSVTGNVGVLYHLSEPTALVLNVGRGFRAPSSFDLFANGVHEGTVAFERGNPNLNTERSLNTDLAFRVQTASVRAEIGTFANYIQNYIFSRPTTEVDSASGFQIFDVSQGDARLLGVEAAFEYHPTRYLHLQGTLDYTNGQNTTSDTPLPSIPPFRATYTVRLEGERAGWFDSPYFSVGGESDTRQTRLDPSEAEFFAESGYQSAGYTLVNLGAGFTLAPVSNGLRVDIALRNALDRKYSNFLSRYKTYAFDPGRNLTVRLSTSF